MGWPTRSRYLFDLVSPMIGRGRSAKTTSRRSPIVLAIELIRQLFQVRGSELAMFEFCGRLERLLPEEVRHQLRRRSESGRESHPRARPTPARTGRSTSRPGSRGRTRSNSERSRASITPRGTRSQSERAAYPDGSRRIIRTGGRSRSVDVSQVICRVFEHIGSCSRHRCPCRHIVMMPDTCKGRNVDGHSKGKGKQNRHVGLSKGGKGPAPKARATGRGRGASDDHDSFS